MFSVDRRLAPTASVLTFLLALAGMTSWASADQIVVKSGAAGSTLSYGGTVTRIEGDTIYFTNASNTETTKPLASVVKLSIDGEPMLNEGEEAFNAKPPDYDKACDAYDAEIRASDRGWLKDWCRVRLIDAANHVGRVDLAARAYIHFVQHDPATAAAHVPQIPASGARGLEDAAGLLSNSIDVTGLSSDQRRQMLEFLKAVDQARGDDKAVAADQARLEGKIPDTRTPSDDNSGGAYGPEPAATASAADAIVQSAKALLAQKDYAKAFQQIEDNKTAFTTAATQVQALFIIAQCQEAQAKSDDDLKDAAISYMRVYAHRLWWPNAPEVPESMFDIAQILEKLREPQEACDAYQVVVKSYQTTAWAAQAKEQCDRLVAAGKATVHSN